MFTDYNETDTKQRDFAFFHFPGTGCGEGYKYPDFLETYNEDQMELSDPASKNKPSTHAKHLREDGARSAEASKQISKGIAELDIERVAEGFAMKSSKERAATLGGLLGTGDITNNERVIARLEEMEQSERGLPKEIVLNGHSRGSINAIMAANEIYKKYGNKVKVHLLLTDPVPGPFHTNEWKKRVIPPNVKSFSAFYTSNSKLFSPFFIPNDLSRLVFTNPDTIVTSFATKNIHHGYMLSDEYPHLKYAKRSILAGITGKTSDYTKKDMQYGTEHGPKTEKYMFKDTDEMQKAQRGYSRKNCHFYAESNLEGIDSPLATNLREVRNDFRHGGETDKEYTDRPEAQKNIYTLPIDKEGSTPEEREAALFGAYRSAFRFTWSADQVFATLLIIPTLGYSANLYNCKQIHNTTYRSLYFIAGAMTLNTLPVAHKLFKDVGLLVINALVKPILDASSYILQKLGTSDKKEKTDETKIPLKDSTPTSTEPNKKTDLTEIEKERSKKLNPT